MVRWQEGGCSCVLCRDKLQPQSKPTLRDLQSMSNTHPVASSSPVLAFSSEPANLQNSQHSSEAPALSIGPASTPQDELSLANITVPLESIKPSKKRTRLCFSFLLWIMASSTPPLSYSSSLLFSCPDSQVACCPWQSLTNTACVSCCTLRANALRLGPMFWWLSSPCCHPLPCLSRTSASRQPSPRYSTSV